MFLQLTQMEKGWGLTPVPTWIMSLGEPPFEGGPQASCTLSPSQFLLEVWDGLSSNLRAPLHPAGLCHPLPCTTQADPVPWSYTCSNVPGHISSQCLSFGPVLGTVKYRTEFWFSEWEAQEFLDTTGNGELDVLKSMQKTWNHIFLNIKEKCAFLR